MSAPNHDALRDAARKATPGPWEVDFGLPFNVRSQAANMLVARTAIIEGRDGQAQEDANAAYIAAAHPAAVRALLDEIALLRGGLSDAAERGMTDPLTIQSHTEALEELLAAADALLATCGEVCTRRQTRDEPAEYADTHEDWAAADLRRAVASARAALNAEQAA
jgi:hypothetical protein